MTTEVEALRMGLRAALAAEAEALRRASELRESGQPFQLVNVAMREAMNLHVRVNQLQRELEKAQTH